MKSTACLVLIASLAACTAAPDGSRQGDAGGRSIAVATPATGPKEIQVAGRSPVQSFDAWNNPVAEATGTGEELRFISAHLAVLNRRSFVQNTEICGYLGRDPQGRLFTTEDVTGREAECYLPTPPPEMTVIASYHTHGTYSPQYDSEFPTTTDMQTDQSDDIDGYIATPGGRLWYVDSDTMTVREICSVGCLPMDPNYRPDEAGRIVGSYSYAALQRHENS